MPYTGQAGRAAVLFIWNSLGWTAGPSRGSGAAEWGRRGRAARWSDAAAGEWRGGVAPRAAGERRGGVAPPRESCAAEWLRRARDRRVPPRGSSAGEWRRAPRESDAGEWRRRGGAALALGRAAAAGARRRRGRVARQGLIRSRLVDLVSNSRESMIIFRIRPRRGLSTSSVSFSMCE